MKKSKIKKVVSIKEWKSQNGVIHYHNLEMENGDKINIGKKKEQELGEELCYKITEEGQQEYNKAKAVNPDYDEKFGGSNKSWKSTETSDDKTKSIIKQVCLKAAAALYSGTKDAEGMFIAWKLIENRFYNKEHIESKEDLPF